MAVSADGLNCKIDENFCQALFFKKTNPNMECSACYACPSFCNCVFRVSTIMFKHRVVPFSQKFLVLLYIFQKCPLRIPYMSDLLQEGTRL